MMNINGLDIELARGDAVSIDISFTEDPPADGTTMLFSVNDYDGPVISKTLEVKNGAAVLELDSRDTDIKEWTYSYGLYVQHTEINGYAPVTEAKFKVKPSEAWRGAVTV